MPCGYVGFAQPVMQKRVSRESSVGLFNGINTNQLDYVLLSRYP